MLLTSHLCKGGVCIYCHLSHFKIEHGFPVDDSLLRVCGMPGMLLFSLISKACKKEKTMMVLVS